MKRYCYFCDSEVEFRVVPKKIEIIIKGLKITYPARIAYCQICGHEIDVPEMDDANIRAANMAYKKKLAAATCESKP